MLQFPEKYRVSTPHLPSIPGQGGAFQIPLGSGVVAVAIASNGFGWEHVSVVVHADKKMHTPTWDQMCVIKDAFWNPEDCVVQYHPPRSEYVNNHPNCLHLWRSTTNTMPQPPSYLVGIKASKQ